MVIRTNKVQERMHGVDKMDKEGNSQEERLLIWKEKGLGWVVNEGRKDQGFGLGTI